jgi:hypothetical protein
MCINIGYKLKRVYNLLKKKLKGLRMPDYPSYDFGEYNLRLRPNDPIRKRIYVYGLPDIINYFNSSIINFDLRIRVVNNKDNRLLKDKIKYEWILCTEDDKQVESTGDPRFHFYDTTGNGEIDLSFEKQLKKIKSDEVNTSDIIRYEDRFFLNRIKPLAVRIGNYSKLGHYKVIMRFTDSSESTSGFIRMAEFTIMEKDKLRHSLLLTLMGLVATGIAAIIFKSCGITW